MAPALEVPRARDQAARTSTAPPANSATSTTRGWLADRGFGKPTLESAFEHRGGAKLGALFRYAGENGWTGEPRRGVTKVPAELSARDTGTDDWACLECEEAGEADEDGRPSARELEEFAERPGPEQRLAAAAASAG